MFDFQDLNQEVVMDHNRSPRNFGEMHDATHSSEGFNPFCGDQLTLYLKIESNLISDVSFTGTGCAISKASASMMTDTIKGQTITIANSIFEEFRKMLTQTNNNLELNLELLGDLEILSGISQFPARIKCGILAWHTLQSAIQGQDSTVTTE